MSIWSNWARHLLRSNRCKGAVARSYQQAWTPANQPRPRFQSSNVTKSRAPPSFFTVSEEVKDALQTNQPVVALETTIYTHGYPYPENLTLARNLEALVRQHGAVPATIGVLDGHAYVGLSDKMLEQLISTKDAGKISRRDIAFTAGMTNNGRRLSGGTTISGTMVLAHLAGIKIFATGGLGGVHRGVEQSMDISADLTELGRTPVTVISSGCKGFLDIPRTLEFLETQGAAVATFADGRDGPVDVPAFWSRDSGIKSPRTLKDEAEAAAVIYAHHSMRLQSGLFFANPVPEEYSIPTAELDKIIEQAVTESVSAGATGSSNTPFVLRRLHELSQGRSAIANTALVKANVVRGAKVASELCKLEGSFHNMDGDSTKSPSSFKSSARLAEHKFTQRHKSEHQIDVSDEINPPEVVVVGSIAIDSACDYKSRAGAKENISPQQWTSNPASITQSIGGVGHNIARAAQLTGANVKLAGVVADDLPGIAALAGLKAEGLDTSYVGVLESSLGHKTAQYIAVNNSRRELHLGMADMSIFEETIDVEKLLQPLLSFQHPPKWLVLDANWDAASLSKAVRFAHTMEAKIVYEPVSAEKSTRLFRTINLEEMLGGYPNHRIQITTPNALELSTMHKAMYDTGLFELQEWWRTIDAIGLPSTGMRSQFSLATSPALVDAGIPQQSVQMLPFIPTIVTTLGAQGVLLTMLLHKTDPRLGSADAAPYILSRSQQENTAVGGVYMRLFHPTEVLKEESIVSVNGAGDTFTGALLSALVQGGENAKIEDLIDFAQQASILTLRSREAVADELKTLALKLKAESQL